MSAPSNRPSQDHADLLHAALDGELSADERVEFERLLERDADARDGFASLQRLTSIVEELEPVAPPADLARATARAISLRKTAGAPSWRTVQGEMIMARKTMILVRQLTTLHKIAQRFCFRTGPAGSGRCCPERRSTGPEAR